jgi:exonuclease III
LDLIKLRYKGYINSTQARRGVAILIKNGISTVITEQYRDRDENILLINCKIKGYDFVLGSVYGPNRDSREFFNELQHQLLRLGGSRTVIGGDWN